jgi:ABC-type Fe3+/spermidine/putrescine transport system ATPase subunit
VALAIRPERLTLSPERPPENGQVSIRGKVLDVAYYGDTSHVSLACPDGLELVVNVQNRQASATARRGPVGVLGARGHARSGRMMQQIRS